MTPEREALVKAEQALDAQLKQATDLQVIDQESASFVSRFVADLKARVRDFKESVRPMKEAAKLAHSKVCDYEKERLGRAEPIILNLSQKIVAWNEAEKEKFRQAEEARARAEFEANQKKREAEKIIEEAPDFDVPAEVVAAAEAPIVLPPAPAKPVTPDLVQRDNWKWKTVDFEAIPRQYLTEDRNMISDIVHRDKDKTRIPGIEVYNEPYMASAARRSI